MSESSTLSVSTRQVTGDPYRHIGYVIEGHRVVSVCCNRRHARRRVGWDAMGFGVFVSGMEYAEKCARRRLAKIVRHRMAVRP